MLKSTANKKPINEYTRKLLMLLPIQDDWWSVSQETETKLKEYLQKGADPNTKASNEDPLLIWASKRDLVDVVQLLLVCGADVTAKNNIKFGGVTAFLQAAFNGNQTIMRLLLKAGADINAQDERSGDTALHKAVIKKSHDLVQFLLDAKADPRVRNKDGETPICYAARYFHGHALFKLIQQLLQAGADINAKDNNGHTALLIACQYANWHAIPTLLLNGANPNLRNNNGNDVWDLLDRQIIDCLNKHQTKEAEKTNKIIDLIKAHQCIIEMRKNARLLSLTTNPQQNSLLASLPNELLIQIIAMTGEELHKNNESFRYARMFFNKPPTMKQDIEEEAGRTYDFMRRYLR